MGEGREDRAEMLLAWVGMVEESQRGWPDLWEEMCRQSVEVLWAILVEFPLHSQLCKKIGWLLGCWRAKYGVSTAPGEEEVLVLLHE
jgi:hypothetical protein